MKYVWKNNITHIQGTDMFEDTFVFSSITQKRYPQDVQVISLKQELEKKKNDKILDKVKVHPAMWSEVYSPKDELEIFTYFFEEARQNNTKIHFEWITLFEEIQMIESYYREEGFFDETINCFDVDFSKVYISSSVHIENLMWRWSDYRRMGKKIFFCPPIREAGQVKSLFTGINRWSIAGILLWDINEYKLQFLKIQLQEEHILPITLWKVLRYNFEYLWCLIQEIDEIIVS